VAASTKFEKINKSSTSAPSSSLSRTRNKSEELLWKLNTGPAVPKIIATRTKHAKSQRIAVTESKNKHDVDVNNKSKRIVTHLQHQNLPPHHSTPDTDAGNHDGARQDQPGDRG
jgi:hypothetical protein